MGMLDFFDIFRKRAKQYNIKVLGADLSIDVKSECLRNTWVVASIEAIANAIIRMGVLSELCGI
ncbi:MAG: hypothetical protein ACK4F9_02645 [Brevinematia bacterium]